MSKKSAQKKPRHSRQAAKNSVGSASSKNGEKEKDSRGRVDDAPRVKRQGDNRFNIADKSQQLADQHTQRQVVERLKKAFLAMSAPPEGILPLLDRLEVAYLAIDPNSEEYMNGDYAGFDEPCLVIKLHDLMEGEKRNQLQGSIFKRLYGESLESVLGQPAPPDKSPQDFAATLKPKVCGKSPMTETLREPEEYFMPEPRSEPVDELPPNTHNPETGEKLGEPVVEPPKEVEPVDLSFEAEPVESISRTVDYDDFEDEEDYLQYMRGMQ